MTARTIIVASRLPGWRAVAFLLAILASAPVHAQPPATPAASAPGATVDELLTIARRMNPELAASALDAEAALARVDAAGSLPDPVFRSEFEEIDRRAGTLRPDRLGSVTYTVMQEFPLWGKLDLKRDVARSEADQAREKLRAAEVELAARIKTVFASYYAAHEALRLVYDLARTVDNLVELTQRRYAQGLGSQQDAIKARIEQAQLKTEIARLEADRRKAAAQLNALLNRPSGASLDEPASLRPLPSESALRLPDLLDRAERSNPLIAAEQSQITAASGSRKLVEKSWYPDVTFGLSAVDRDRRFAGYEAMVELKLPLRWGLREAQEREAAAKVGAAQSRLDAAKAKVRGELEEAYWGLDATRRVFKVLHEVHIPQTTLALETALRAYEVNRADLTAVLEAEQRARQVLLEHLRVLIEQQVRLAEIEKLIGGEL